MSGRLNLGWTRMRVETDANGRRSVRSTLSAARAGAAVLAALTALGVPAAAQSNTCRATANAVQRACRRAAQSDNLLALAKCDNITDPAARSACRSQAMAELADALATCGEQRDARVSACGKLGPAPYDPQIDPSNFVATIDNPYFPLVPGTTFVYEGATASGFEHSEFAVTHNTKTILGVACVEVRDTVLLDGELAEDTLDWFAQDVDGNVWYFGENTHELAGGLVVTIDGTFTAGGDGDKPGIVMRAHPAVGDFYRQEFSLGNAEDFAEVASLTETVGVPLGSFKNCLKTTETTPLETDLLESKYYAPGVGNVLTVDERTGDRTALVRITTE